MKLDDFRLERYFAQHEFTAPYILCASDCESMEIRELLALEPEAHERFSSLRLGYTDSLGDLNLRNEITSLYEHINTAQVLVHSGAEEAIFNFMNVALNPGDHIIVHAPYYQSLGEVAIGIGAAVTEWKGDPENAWEMDLDYLKGLLNERTRVVVVNFPHNPTGFLPDPGLLQELSALSEKHGFIILSDEVYRGLELEPSDRLPAFADVNDSAVSLGVMSKTYGLAGLRIGWIATQNDQIFNKMTAFKDYTTICSSAPSEFLATLALRHAGVITDRNQEIIRTNLSHLDLFFADYEHLFSWNPPRAGSIAFPKLLKGKVDAFCSDLVNKAGVLLLPGTLYGPEYNNFRIGFGRRDLPEGLARLKHYLES